MLLLIGGVILFFVMTANGWGWITALVVLLVVGFIVRMIVAGILLAISEKQEQPNA